MFGDLKVWVCQSGPLADRPSTTTGLFQQAHDQNAGC